MPARADGAAPGGFTTCGPTVLQQGLADGTYRLEVRSVDAAGNRSASVLSDPVTIDNAGPAAPTVALDVTSGRTRSATWSVTPSEDGTTSSCRLTRTAPDGSTSLVKDWSPCSDYTFALLQGDGTYRLEVRSLDALGNVGAGQVGPGYLLDATPPPPPTVTGSRTGTGSATALTYAFSGEGRPRAGSRPTAPWCRPGPTATSLRSPSRSRSPGRVPPTS